MAILVVRIEDDSTLLMNEFFDYNGVCYGLTRSREKNDEICINLEDFYEGTVQSECLTDVPVFFCAGAGRQLVCDRMVQESGSQKADPEAVIVP